MLHGGATADMQRLTIGRRDGGTRHLVLRSFVAPTRQGPAEDLLHREADALTALTSTGVSAPGLVAVDPTAAHCEYPSLLKHPPRYKGRFLHQDFQPGNVLFDLPPEDPAGAVGARITGVVDWAAASWGPADLDVAHCSTNLALLHGPVWGLRFAEAYQDAGGMLAADSDERLYWQVRAPLAFSEEVQ
ncbi:hypothetical protein SUDANB150_07759 (plasmid) [Streptomyces sp. enrichment culture]